MKQNRKEEIILTTLELASKNGIGNVSMNMIAEKIGIKKPSLYNHFSSKEEIVEEMYHYLREQSKEKSNLSIVDYGAMIEGKTALEVLQLVVSNYQKINADKKMQMFYKVIYSERCMQSVAAQIIVEETEKMILATKQLFYAMQIHGLLKFNNPDISAISFAMTIHGLMDYEMDKEVAKLKNQFDRIQEYLEWFCKENQIK